MTIHMPKHQVALFAAALLICTSIIGLPLIAGGHMQSEKTDHSSHNMDGMDHSSHGAKKAEGMDHSSHSSMDHGGHQMTPEMMQQLRDRIPLYQRLNDQQIMLNMRMMPPNGNMYVSDTAVNGEFGILAISHGFSGSGNEELRDEFIPLSTIFPTAIGYGMSMMSSSHMQEAVDQLTAKGVKKIIIMPMVSVRYGSMMDQFNYIFGDRPEGAYADVPKIKTSAKLVMASTPGDSPEIATILIDYAREFSENEANEDVMILSHGPEGDKDNELELGILENLSEIIRTETDFNSVQAFTIQDDAIRPIRAANVKKMREHIEKSTSEGRKVIIVTNLLTSVNLSEKIRKDLAGLDFEISAKGLMTHPRFRKWMDRTVMGASFR